MAMGLAKCEVCSLAGVMRPERRQNGVGITRLSDSALNVVTLEIDVSTTDKNCRPERHNPMANIECAVREIRICFSGRLTIKNGTDRRNKKGIDT